MGLIVMADAINRAKSTDGEKIREALVATDMPGEATIMPWKRVKFDEMGQNNDADPVLLQYVGGKFVTIFPPQAAVAEAIMADEMSRRSLERHHKRSVVPANAGTHTPRSIGFIVASRPSFKCDSGGYGSLRSQGRPAIGVSR